MNLIANLINLVCQINMNIIIKQIENKNFISVHLIAFLKLLCCSENKNPRKQKKLVFNHLTNLIKVRS